MWYIVECGVHVDPTKRKVFHNGPALKTLTKLHSFLGITNLSCKFILWLSHIAWPLSQVTKGGAKDKFVWDEALQ